MSRAISCRISYTYRQSRLTIHRAGLPKKTQTYLFFVINQFRVEKFRHQLAKLIPLITTTAQVFEDQELIAHTKKIAAHRGQAPPLLRLSGVNISFSHRGLQQVGSTFNSHSQY